MYSRFNCALCSEVYKTPKLLPCFHTYCEYCLYDYIGKHTKQERFCCPGCKTEIQVPHNIADDFNTNHYVIADIEQNLGKAVELGLGECDICRKQADAGLFCNECEQRMCEDCSSVHSSMKATKHHKVKTLQKSPHRLVVQSTCQEHQEEMHFYCRTCCQGICVHCKVTKHQGHTTEHTEDVKDTGRQKLKSLSGILSDHLRDLRCELEAITYRKRLIENGYEETRRCITLQAENICQNVYAVRNEKLLESKEVRDEQMGKLKEVEYEIKNWEQQMTNMDEYITTVSKCSSDVGVLETCDLVKDKIRKTGDYQCPSCDLECIEFEAEESVRQLIKNMFGRMNRYPVLRLRLSYGPVDYFDCGTQEETVDAVCPMGNKTAWVASHIASEEKSSISLFDSKGKLLRLISCEQVVKCFAILDKTVHVLTKDSFLQMNEEQTDLGYIIVSSPPLLISSNATSMFYLSRDHTCYYVSNTDVRPAATTFLCSLKGLKHPVKMAVDDNQNIVLVDSTLKSVSVFDFNGVIQTKYSITYENFFPLDVYIDRWADMLVVDGGNGAIHELATDGKGREIMYSRFSGLKNVCCIGGDDDTWWFGSTDGKIAVKYFK